MRLACMIFVLAAVLLGGGVFVAGASVHATASDDCWCKPFCECGPGCACCTVQRPTHRGPTFTQAVTQSPTPIAASVGGRHAPDGREIEIDLPGSLHRRNTAARGLGLCVFTSLHHAGLWQNVPQVVEFPKWVIDKGYEGGGWPQRVATWMREISASRGMPEPEYIQIEGDDVELLKLACATGRLPAVTYGYSPTGRYNGQAIAHMVNLAHMDDQWACVLDNNYPGDTQYEWMTPAEFKGAYRRTGGGWSVILLSPGPSPPPSN
jgi:hypothetical protein